MYVVYCVDCLSDPTFVNFCNQPLKFGEEQISTLALMQREICKATSY